MRPRTDRGEFAAVGVYYYNYGYVCLLSDGSFIKLEKRRLGSVKSAHGWTEGSVRRHAEHFACPAEFME